MLYIYTDWSCFNEWEAKKIWESATDEWWIWIAIYCNSELLHTISKNYINTTNNKMELLAIYEWIKHCLPYDDITVISDSQYAIKSVADFWINSETQKLEKWWKRKESDYKKLKNVSYIKAIKKLIKSHGKVYFSWVRWHTWNVWNELADKLSNRRDNLSIDKFLMR